MKPILLIPPAPGRWPTLQDVLAHKGPPWITDLEQRFMSGVPGAQDAYAVQPAGGQLLAVACINKCGDLGVLGHCYTRPEQRRRGHARRMVEAVLSWFDMTGGKWLFLATTAELDEGLYRKFGFTPLRRLAAQPHDRLTMLRCRGGGGDDPFAQRVGEVDIRDVTRAQWPALAALLQYHTGPDPRVSLDESAVTAEAFTLDLLEQQERGACQLKAAYAGHRLVALASIATDRVGEHTHAMLIPHSGAPAALRTAVAEFARLRGFAHVDYPLEALALPLAGAAETGAAGAGFGPSEGAQI